jgi:hypothetical protein
LDDRGDASSDTMNAIAEDLARMANWLGSAAAASST